MRTSQFLDFAEFRPLTLVVMAHTLGRAESAISEAFARLAECGYLDRSAGEQAGGDVGVLAPFSWADDRVMTCPPTAVLQR